MAGRWSIALLHILDADNTKLDRADILDDGLIVSREVFIVHLSELVEAEWSFLGLRNSCSGHGRLAALGRSQARLEDHGVYSKSQSARRATE